MTGEGWRSTTVLNSVKPASLGGVTEFDVYGVIGASACQLGGDARPLFDLDFPFDFRFAVDGTVTTVGSCLNT